MSAKRKRSKRVMLRAADILSKMQEQAPDFEDDVVEEKEDVYEDFNFMVAGNEDEDDQEEQVSAGEPEEIFW